MNNYEKHEMEIINFSMDDVFYVVTASGDGQDGNEFTGDTGDTSGFGS